MMADTPSPSVRSRQSKMARINGSSSPHSYSSPSPSYSSTTPTKRNTPYLPTPLETLGLLAYPTLLAFGALFSIVSPQTRGAPYDAATGYATEAPSYFARKDNVFNTLFVKRGWAWITIAFASFVLTHASFRSRSGGGGGGGMRKTGAAIGRWVLVTGWWVLVTQWCFGPPLIDRGFRFTGGRCEVATEAVAEGAADKAEVFTAAACRAAKGRWSGGHDVSGHVFLLVLGSWFLLQEVGWVVGRAGFLGAREQRCVVMSDGAVKGAGVEAGRVRSGGEEEGEERTLGFGGRFALVVVVLCWWMLLMTAIYFHTWFEKLTGLLVAFVGIYPIYILPRFVPVVRTLVGLPGI